MVHLIDCGKKEFIEQTKGKKVYCFGAGKYFQYFVDNDYGVKIEAVIDNYRCQDGTKLFMDKELVEIIPIETFLQKYDANSVVMITAYSIEDILEQLDSIDILDGMPCYVEWFVREQIEESAVYIESKSKEQVIPKKIHYCWFGESPISEEYQKYIDSWKKYCPDYEIIRWDESNYDINKIPFIRQAYDQKKWAFVTDYVRLDVLYQEGGIYLDTDVEVVASFDKFLSWEFFCGFEESEYVAWGLGFGAIKGHKILKAVMDIYEKMSFVNEDSSLNLLPCPVIQSEVLQKFGFVMNGEFQVKDNVALYPRDFFSPYKNFTCFGRITKNTHSIHHYAGTWCDELQKKQKKEFEDRILKIKSRNNISVKEDYAEQNKINVIKKYQIWECMPKTHTAGSKAPTDAKIILGDRGYQVISIHPMECQKGDNTWEWKHQRLIEEWNQCYEMISENSIVFLQHPFWQEQKERNETLLKLKKEKKVKIISLVHDVESLRKMFQSEYTQQEFNFMLEIADVLIVHNHKMKEYFISLGIDEVKIVTLDIFDYLLEKDEKTEKIFNSSISIAGNLDVVKSPYIGKLQELKNVKVHLYGPNYKEEKSDNETSTISYHGSFPPNEVPMQLTHGFGLVWDGDSLEGCTGNTGEYLKYNNPHKLSLYLAAGLPVIVWRKAAIADFVLQQGIGIVVDSLKELDKIFENITKKEYEDYIERLQNVSVKVKRGDYMFKALNCAEEKVYGLHG